MTPSHDDFAQLAIEHLRARAPTLGVDYDAPRFMLRVQHGPSTHFVFLAHAFKEYTRADVQERSRVLSRRLWTAAPSGEVPTEELLRGVLPRLRDVVHPQVQLRQLQAQLDDPAAIERQRVPNGVFAEQLSVNCIYELPTSTMDIAQNQLAAWGIDFDGLLARAIENLARRTTRPFREIQPGLFLSPHGDGCDAARILLTDRILKLELKGEPVAAVPTSDVLLVCGSNDAGALAAMAKLVKEAVEEPHALTGEVFRWESNTWQPWLPAANHPAYQALQFLRLQSTANVYAAQKELLDAWHHFRSEELFVAPYLAYRAEGGGVFTSTTWTDGVAALLPLTDRIDFVHVDDGDERPKVWSVKAEIAVQTVGALLEATQERPARVRTLGFPTEQQLEQMRLEDQ